MPLSSSDKLCDKLRQKKKKTICIKNVFFFYVIKGKCTEIASGTEFFKQCEWVNLFDLLYAHKKDVSTRLVYSKCSQALKNSYLKHENVSLLVLLSVQTYDILPSVEHKEECLGCFFPWTESEGFISQGCVVI